MVETALGLGANLGDRCGNIIAALKALDERPDVTVTRISSIYATPPWGLADQPDFLNAAVLLDTSLSPYALLDVCQGIERNLGRKSGPRWGPREIDIDILNIDGVSLQSERLTLPHKHLLERLFVLLPLDEIWDGRLTNGESPGNAIDGCTKVGGQSGIKVDDPASARVRTAF